MRQTNVGESILWILLNRFPEILDRLLQGFTIVLFLEISWRCGDWSPPMRKNSTPPDVAVADNRARAEAEVQGNFALRPSQRGQRAT